MSTGTSTLGSTIMHNTAARHVNSSCYCVRPWLPAALSVVCLVCLVGCGTGDGNGLVPVRTFPRTTAWQSANVNRGANAQPAVVVMADMNTDGLSDAVVGYPGTESSTPEIAIFFQVNALNWQRLSLLQGPGATGVAAIAVGDVSGDGRADIIAACNGQIIYLRSPENVLSQFEWFTDGIAGTSGAGIGQWTDVAIAQIDGLFGPDLVACNAEPGRLSFIRGPQFPFTGQNWQRIDIDNVARSGASALLMHDVDRDGRLDVVSAARGETQARIVWYRHPGGIFDQPIQWSRFAIGNLTDPVRLSLGDMNRDGRTDVVVTSPGERRIGWYAQPTDVIVGEWTGLALADFDSNTPVDAQVADVDANGQPDIIVSTANQGTLRWFTPVNDVNTRWIENNLADLTANAGRFAVQDIDRNGRPDVVVPLIGASAADDAIAWFRNPEF